MLQSFSRSLRFLMLSNTPWLTWMGESSPRVPGFHGTDLAARLPAIAFDCSGFACMGRTIVGGGLAFDMTPAYEDGPETELGVLDGGGGAGGCCCGCCCCCTGKACTATGEKGGGHKLGRRC